MSNCSMVSTVWTFLLVCVVLGSVVWSASLPEMTDVKFIDECVREHNTARSNVNPPASNMLHMTWDEGLAITARAWARRCLFKHNIYLGDVHRVHPTFSSVGENIWTGAPPSFDVSRAIGNWVNEVKDYNYQNDSCTSVCGHYTQVVWADSYKVGCAVQLCPNGVKYFTEREGVLFVCNYALAGNWNGRRPYDTEGAACSKCEGVCEDKLCKSPARDSQKSYNWTPDWDPAQTGRSDHVTILIIRLVALAIVFAAAHAVRYFYADVFCYE